MLRGSRLALGLAAVLTASVAAEARAQFGYGYPGGYGGYGWGGWGGAGSTVQGSIAQGMGYYLQGAGVYNQRTAIANSINTDTVMRWNQYMYESQKTANYNERLRLARRQAEDSGASAAREKQLRENPTDRDISSGNALNSALDQITNPKVHSSTLRLATAKIPGKVVRDIPFVNASEAVTISLDKLTAEDGWPLALRDSKFDDERKAYSKAVDKALDEDRDGDLKAATIQDVRDTLAKLKTKFEANRPADPAQFGEAERYMKTLYGMTRMLERPDVEKIVAEAENIKETTLGSLLGFMHNFNLRFGPAETPSQRAAYAALYPLIDDQRDRVQKALEGNKDDAATPPPPPPTDFHSGIGFEHLEGPHRIKQSAKPVDN